MSDTQLLYTIAGLLILALMICTTVYLSAKQNRAQAIALVQEIRANQPAMDTMENLAKNVVPVGLVFAAMALVLPTLPATTDEEKQLKASLADLFKNLSDGKPWTPPVGATMTTVDGAGQINVSQMKVGNQPVTDDYTYVETMKDGVLSASKTPIASVPPTDDKG